MSMTDHHAGHTTDATGHDQGSDDSSSYLRFGAMIATAALVMFGLKYTSTYALEHVYFSETRAWMTLLMAGSMGIVMLGFMLGMYKNTKINAAIVIGSLVLMAGSLFFLRSQTTVDDRDYMEGMIPHHSIAVLTSERAQIEDLRVRKLANEIITAQRKEIKEMEWLIADIEENGPATTPEEAQARPVPDFSGEIDPQGGEVTQPQEEDPLEPDDS
jgi:hypothetical protein